MQLAWEQPERAVAAAAAALSAAGQGLTLAAREPGALVTAAAAARGGLSEAQELRLQAPDRCARTRTWA